MVRLRPATEADWARLFCWRNDPETRAHVHSGDVVELSAHLKWLRATLANQDIKLFVARDSEAGNYVGTVRLDLDKKAIHYSVTVEPHQRGKGYGEQIIAATLESMPDANGEKWRNADRLVASIKPDNYASLRAFADNGFLLVKVTPTLVVLERAR